MEGLCTSFPPVADAGCRALVLGSMPGALSLAAEQYYAHPRNAFWPVLYALWDEAKPDDAYAARLRFALARRVAIWDVVKTCVRPGSADADIKDAIPNDFEAFFAVYPDIHTVFFNGNLARSLFMRHCSRLLDGREAALLPSTSPAYTMPVERKLDAWRQLRQAAEGISLEIP